MSLLGVFTHIPSPDTTQETLREIYDRVEKTDDIKRYETAPRPER